MSAQVRIRALAYGGTLIGDVVGGAPEQIGKKAFVPFAAPKELIEINITKEDKRLLHGQISSILEPSPERRTAPCPYFTSCGGCDLQHLGIALQRRLKVEMVESTLHNQGGIIPINGVQLSKAELPEFGYRRRITLHLSNAGLLGFYRAGSGDVVPISKCLLASESINQTLAKLLGVTKELAQFTGAVVLEEDSTGSVSVLLIPRPSVTQPPILPANILELFPGISVRGQPHEVLDDQTIGHFSQVNAAGNQELIRLVCAAISDSAVTDLYAGAGNFSIPLAKTGINVHAVELDRALVLAGEKAAKAAGLRGIKFTQSSCEQFVKLFPLAPAVVLDPPRGGAREVVKRFNPKITKQIVYVSCNLPSLVRDLKILKERGYKIEHTTVVDMFSQTHHVETVTRISS